MIHKTSILATALTTLLLGTTGTATAAAFFVGNAADMPDIAPGDGLCNAGAQWGCTLRAAVMETNALPGWDSITLPSLTFNLTNVGFNEDFAARGDLDIRDHVTIVGDGPTTIIDGQFADRIFDIRTLGPIPLVVAIGEMTIRRGSAGNQEGGAIRNASHLSTYNLSITDSLTNARGGGIAGVAPASFSLLNTRVQANRAGNKDCSVPGGGGGGIFIPAGSSPHVVIEGSIIKSNSTCRNGGGILADSAIRLIDTSVESNVTESGANFGGGIYAGVVELDRVTLYANRSWSGAGLSFNGEARIINSTFSGNGATRGGSAIQSSGWLEMRHVTMANNTTTDWSVPSGGLVHNGGYKGFPLPLIINSILSDNTQANCKVLDYSGASFPLTNNSARNVDTDNSCGFGTVGPNASFVLVPAMLAPLAANPGTQGRTHLLVAVSPAKDAASTFDCPKKDQRFLNRPIGAGCDIGATEQ